MDNHEGIRSRSPVAGLPRGRLSFVEVLGQSVAAVAPSAVMVTVPVLILPAAGHATVPVFVATTFLFLAVGYYITQFSTRMVAVSGDQVVSYVHNAAAEGMGKIGVLVALKDDAAKAQEIGKQIAMHIAATSPASLSEADLDPALVEREKSVLTEQARESGKPDAVIEGAGSLTEAAQRVHEHARRHAGADTWVGAVGNQEGRTRGVLSPRVGRFGDAEAWRHWQAKRHRTIDTIAPEDVADLRFVGGLGEPAYWCTGRTGTQPGHGASACKHARSRWESLPRDDDGGAVAEEALVGGDAAGGALDLAAAAVVFGLLAHDERVEEHPDRERQADGGGTRTVATLNGTAITSTRPIVAILENHQQADGSVRVPSALQPFLGTEVISPR